MNRLAKEYRDELQAVAMKGHVMSIKESYGSDDPDVDSSGPTKYDYQASYKSAELSDDGKSVVLIFDKTGTTESWIWEIEIPLEKAEKLKDDVGKRIWDIKY